MEEFKAKRADLKKIMMIVNDAKAYLKANGVDQWQDGYPDETVILEDIENGEGYILKDDEGIFGYFALKKRDENYLKIIGKWQSDQKYLAIHRNMIRKDHLHKGYGRKMFDFIEMIAIKMGYHYLRIDTHKDNKAMLALLERCDYRYAGVITLNRSKESRNAYDKILEREDLWKQEQN